VVRESFTQEIKEVFKLTLLDTLVILVGTPSSGITLERNCIQNDIGILKPILDQPIGHLTAIVKLRTTLENILSSTKVIR
jgi:hypothetical protein